VALEAEADKLTTRPGNYLPEGANFPRLMIPAFQKEP
jgi:hypothetical protein